MEKLSENEKNISREADLNHRPKDRFDIVRTATVLRSTNWAITGDVNVRFKCQSFPQAYLMTSMSKNIQ